MKFAPKELKFAPKEIEFAPKINTMSFLNMLKR